MCSQPPRDVDDAHLIEELIAAVPLFDPSTPELGITGGELTCWAKIIELLNKNYLPRSAVRIDKRPDSKRNLVRKIAELQHLDLMFGIPHSDIVEHDFVVQAKERMTRQFKASEPQGLRSKVEIPWSFIKRHTKTTPARPIHCSQLAVR